MKRGLGKTSGACFVAAEGRGVKVSACLKGRSTIELVAHREGARVGHAFLEPIDGRLIVEEIEVADTARRAGVGTVLYEAAVAVGCRAGLQIASDSMRSQYAESFWRKQAGKGRATCEPGSGSYYDGPTKGIRRDAGLPIPNVDEDGGYEWTCKRYAVRAPCEVKSLASVRPKALPDRPRAIRRRPPR